jgi:hypothetical protein
VGIHVTLLACLGLWLSLVSRTAVSAYFGMALVLLLLFTGSFLSVLHSTVPRGYYPPTWAEQVQEVGLNPVMTWWNAAFSWTEWLGEAGRCGPLFPWTLSAVATGLLLCAAAAGLLWLAACGRMRHEG